MKEELGEERPEVAKVTPVQDEMTIDIMLRRESNNMSAKVFGGGPDHQAGCVVKVLHSF